MISYPVDLQADAPDLYLQPVLLLNHTNGITFLLLRRIIANEPQKHRVTLDTTGSSLIVQNDLPYFPQAQPAHYPSCMFLSVCTNLGQH